VHPFGGFCKEIARFAETLSKSSQVFSDYFLLIHYVLTLSCYILLVFRSCIAFLRYKRFNLRRCRFIPL